MNTRSTALRAAGAVCIAVGLIALAGWHTGYLRLASWGANFVTLKYNTSLAAILCGVGLLMATGSSRRWTWLVLTAPFIVAVVTLYQYASGRSVGIDELITTVPDIAVPGIPHAPGRMAPNAATSFLLGSIAIWFIARGVRVAAAVAAHAGAVLLSIGFVALAGYALGLPPVYSWGPFTPISLPGATVATALGMGLTVWAWETVRSRPEPLPHWLPVPTAIAVFATMVIVWQAMVAGDATALSAIHERGAKEIVIGIGLFASLCFAIALGLVQHSRAQTAELRALNTTLYQVVAEREQKAAELRDSEERFRLAFDSAGTGMALIGLDLRVLQVNAALCEMLGYGEDEVVGQPLTRFTDAADTQADETSLRRLLSGEVAHVRLEKRYRRRSGDVFWALVTRAMVRDAAGRPLYVIAHVDDIDVRKTAEERLGKQAAALAASNAELEQFAYVASHDLQEPLRMVSSYTQLLARRYKGKLGTDADEFIGYAVDGARRMQTLIEDLLSYSRVGRRGEPQAVDLNEAYAVVRRTLSRAIDDLQAAIAVEPLPTVRAVPFEMEQVLQNLLSNALKFHGSSPPRIEVTAQSLGSEWRIAVRDHGIGIEPQYVQRIFFMFQRLHSRDVYPGNGIGLALCKKIVERHGGRIGVEETPGGGATFWFTMPKREGEAYAA